LESFPPSGLTKKVLYPFILESEKGSTFFSLSLFLSLLRLSLLSLFLYLHQPLPPGFGWRTGTSEIQLEIPLLPLPLLFSSCVRKPFPFWFYQAVPFLEVPVHVPPPPPPFPRALSFLSPPWFKPGPSCSFFFLATPPPSGFFAHPAICPGVQFLVMTFLAVFDTADYPSTTKLPVGWTPFLFPFLLPLRPYARVQILGFSM